ncbi:energy transducer TonB [Pseudoduganella sp. SL102]|uniref:energy transducer TonB n=1 Tax=Pseudoduganella sp. SL102 TaxID=2995154 RepID=UPI00248B9436|nr:energy transducer TonB [Pseudoduganella sp. SL102]WBS03502.1 energy transducer TonB [Pseudoduganella sp. SL102]
MTAFSTLPRLPGALATLATFTALATMSAAPALAEPVRTAAVADFRTCARPVWPKEAVQNKQQGTVTLSFLISDSGAVTDSKVTRSSSFPLLDVAALEGIMKCRFRPSTVDGKPIPAWVQMQYVWTLDPAASKPDGFVYRKAAAAGDNNAREGLARLYEQGLGVPQDKAATIALRKTAASTP